MTEKRERQRHGDSKADLVIAADRTGFTVRRIGEHQAAQWQEDVRAQNISPDFSELAIAGLSAINASLHEIVENDVRLAQFQKMALFAEESGKLSLNNAIHSSAPELWFVGTGREKTSELFWFGFALLETAVAATQMQRMCQPRITTGTTAAGWKIKESTRDILIPNTEQREAGNILNTYPAIGVAMRYTQTDRGGGFENPDELQFASPLWSRTDPSSKFVNVFFPRKSTTGYKEEIVNIKVHTGFVVGIFGESGDFSQRRDLQGFSTLIRKHIPQNP